MQSDIRMLMKDLREDHHNMATVLDNAARDASAGRDPVFELEIESEFRRLISSLKAARSEAN